MFAIANQLPGFSISRLANVEDFFNVYIYIYIYIYIFKFIKYIKFYKILILNRIFSRYRIEIELFQDKKNIEIIGL